MSKISSPISFKDILNKLKEKYTEIFSDYPNNIDYYTSLFVTENMKKYLELIVLERYHIDYQ